MAACDSEKALRAARGLADRLCRDGFLAAVPEAGPGIGCLAVLRFPAAAVADPAGLHEFLRRVQLGSLAAGISVLMEGVPEDAEGEWVLSFAATSG